MSSKTGADIHRQWSLAARLTFWYTGSAFVLIVATVSFLYWALVTTLEHEDDQYLLDKANMLLAAIRDAPADDRELRAEIGRESGPRPTGQLYLRVLDASGKTIAETNGMNEHLPSSRFAEPVAADIAADHTAELETATGRMFRVVAIKTSSTPTRIIHIAMDRTAEESLLFRYRCYAGGAIGVALIVCAFVGHALARRGLRPLRDITQAAQRVQSSTLHERIESDELPAELSDLANKFNEMLNRLEDSFRRLEQFSADIAHELRTPVNNLRGEAEVALSKTRSANEYQEVLASSLEELARLTGLIDSLLFLARAESPQSQIMRQTLDIGKELATVREFFQAAAHEAGVELVVQIENPITAELDRTLFQRAIGNLISNSLVHTPMAGKITLTASQSADEVVIEVADTGCGIAPEHLPHVFERLYRADPARASVTGSVGLGLALVESIVTMHGGRCTIESTVNQGTRAKMILPCRGAHSGQNMKRSN